MFYLMKYKQCYIFVYQSNENRAIHFFGGTPGIIHNIMIRYIIGRRANDLPFSRSFLLQFAHNETHVHLMYHNS